MGICFITQRGQPGALWWPRAFGEDGRWGKLKREVMYELWLICVAVWQKPFFGSGMKTALFQSCGHCWAFQICWHTECSTFTASSCRIWNSLTGIPSPPLALFVVMLSKALFYIYFHQYCSILGQNYKNCRGGKNFLYLLKFYDWGLRIKLTKTD